MRKQSAAMIVLIAGVVMIGSVIATSLFARSSAFDRLSANTAVQFSDEGIAAVQGDVDALEALTRDLPSALELLGTQAGLTPEQLQAFIADYPAVAQGLEALPTISAELAVGADLIASEQARFESADAIPTSSQATTTVPWFLVIMGLFAIVAGVVMMSGSERAPLVAAILGVVILVVPLVTMLPTKAGNSDTLNRNIAPLFSAEYAAQVEGAQGVLIAFGDQLETEMIPAIATLLDTTPEAVTEGLTQFVPSVGAALTRAPDAIARLGATVELLEANRADFVSVSGTRYVPIQIMSLIAGLLILMAAVVAMRSAGTTLASAGSVRTARRHGRAA